MPRSRCGTSPSLLRGIRLWKQGPTQLQYRPATNDVLRTGFGQFDQDQTQWNNQVEFTWKHKLAGRDNTFVAGTDGEWLDFTRYVTQWPGISDIVSLVNPVPGVYPTVAATITQAQNNLVHRYSAFTEDRIKVSKRLSLVGGLRWDTQDLNRIDLVTRRAHQRRQALQPGELERRRGLRDREGHECLRAVLGGDRCPQQRLLHHRRADGVQRQPRHAVRGRHQAVDRPAAAPNGPLAGYRIVKNDLLVPGSDSDRDADSGRPAVVDRGRSHRVVRLRTRPARRRQRHGAEAAATTTSSRW